MNLESIRSIYLENRLPNEAELRDAKRVSALSSGLDAAFASALVLRFETDEMQAALARNALGEIVARFHGTATGETVELLLILSLLPLKTIGACPEFREFAIRSMQSAFSPVRTNATQLLDRFAVLGDHAARESLSIAASDNDPSVRRNAQIFLDRRHRT